MRRLVCSISRGVFVMAESTSDETEPFTLIGLFTVSFAAAEAGLDICNAAIFRHCGGSAVDSKIPRSLKRKVAFFQKCQTECPLLATADEGFRLWAAKIIAEFEAIRSDRHFIIHGLATEALKGQAISFWKPKYEKLSISGERKIMSVPHIQDVTKRSWKLVETTITFAVFLLRFIPTEQLDKALGELDAEFLTGLPLGQLPTE